MGILGDGGEGSTGGVDGNTGNGGSGSNLPGAGSGSSLGSGDGGGNSGNASAGSGSGGDGAPKSWRDSLPDDLKNDTSLQKYSDIPNLAKAFVHLNGLVGKKGVVPPTEKSSDEEWSSFYDQLGRPPLDKYEVKTPEGLEVNKEFVGKFKEAAHKQGVLPKQAQAILDFYISTEKEMVASQQAAHEIQVKAGLAKLKEELGEGYAKHVALGEQAIKETGLDPEWVKKTGLGKDPTFIKFMAKVGALYGEDKIRGEGGGPMGGNTPAEIDSQIQKLQSHPAYLDRNHREHKLINQQMDALYQRKFPTKTG